MIGAGACQTSAMAHAGQPTSVLSVVALVMLVLSLVLPTGIALNRI